MLSIVQPADGRKSSSNCGPGKISHTRLEGTNMSYRGNVLIVEDDVSTRELTAALVEALGYSVMTAESANDALRCLYSEEACDVLLSDIRMPDMSGLDLIGRAQDARPGLPVVLISGDVDGIAEAMHSGRLALTKPVRRERLSSVLFHVLHHDSSKPFWQSNDGTK